MSKKKNIDINIQKRISGLLEKLSNNKGENNKEVVEFLQDIQNNELIINEGIKRSKLFDYMQEAVAIYEAVDNGKDFKFVNFNTAAEKTENIKREKLIGKKITEVFPGVVEFGLLDVLRKVWKSGKPQKHPISIYGDDRIIGWRENYVYKLPTGEVVASYIDKTKEKQAEKEVKLSETNLKSLINNRNESIWSIDSEYNYIIFNDFYKEQYFQLFKIELEIGINALDLLTGDLYDFWKGKYDKALAGEKYSFEFSTNVKKSTYYYEVSLNPIISNNKISGVSAISTDITERKKVDEAIRINVENYKGIFNTSSDAIYIQDKMGVFIDVNLGVEKMYGYPRESFIGNTPEFISAPGKNDIDAIIEAVNNAYNGKEQKFEYWGLRKNGEVFPKNVRLYPGKYNGNKVVIAVAQDVSEIKKAEKAVLDSEVKFKNLLHFAPDAFFHGDGNGDFIACNEAAAKLTGYSCEDLVKMNMQDLFSKNMLNEKPLRYDLLKTGMVVKSERTIVRKNNEIINVEMSSKKMSDGTFQSFFRDITERKISENALRESEEKYRKIISNLRQVYYEADSKGLITHCSSELSVFTGFSEKELIGKRSFTIVSRDSWAEVIADYQKCLKEKTTYSTSEFRISTKNGINYWVEQLRNFQYDEKGNFVKATNIVKDISERKKSEEALHESERNFRLLFENSPLGTYVADTEGNIIDGNKALLEMLGSPSIEYTKKINVLKFQPLVKNGYSELFKKCLKEKKTVSIDMSYTSKWGTDNTYSSYVVPLLNSDGEVERVYTIMEDITKRKEAQEALRESEEIFRNLSESTATALFVYQNEKFVFVNRSTEILTGYSKNELIGMNFWDVVHPTFRGQIKGRGLARQRGEEVPSRYEIKLLRKDGSTAWVDFTAGKISWKGKEAAIGSAFNISDRKNAEEKLGKSEEKYRVILESASDYLFTAKIPLRGNSQMDWVGGSFEKITGYTFDEYLENGSWVATLHPEDVFIDKEAFEELKNNRKAEIEVRLFHKNGKIIWVRASTTPIWSDKEQRVVSIYGAVKDITEEKEIEERYRLVSDLTSDYIFAVDIDEDGKTTSTWAGGSFQEITGYTFEEYKAAGGWRGTLHPDDIEKDKAALKKLEKNEKVKIEVRTFHKSGKIVWIATFGSPVWDKRKNRLIGVNGACTDITKEKLASIALKESEEKYRILSNTTSDYVYETKIDEKGGSNLIWVGGSFEEITGYTFEEYKKIGGWRAVIHPEDIKIDNDAYQKSLENKVSSLEVRTYNKSGKIIWVKAVGYPIWDYEKNKLSGILGSVEDITKEKEALISLQESEEKYKLISNITSDYIFESRFNEKEILDTVWVAGSFREMTGYTLEEYRKAGGWSNLLYKDDVEIDAAALEELKKNRKATLEVRTKHKDGNIIWVKNSCSPIWDKDNNKLVGIIGAAQDITKDKRQQLARQIQYNIADAVISVKSTIELFSIVRKELVQLIDAKNFFVAFYNESNNLLTTSINYDKEQVRSWKAEKSITGIVIETKKTLFLKKAEIISIAKEKNLKLSGVIPEVWLGVPLNIRTKVIGAIVVQSYDNSDGYDKLSLELIEVIASQLSLFIGKNKVQEDALRLSRAIVQSPVSVVITLPDGSIEYVNPQFEKNSGYTFEEIFGKNSRIVKSGYHSEEYYKEFWNTLLTGDDWRGEFLNKKKNGDLYWENVSISSIQDNNGKITHFVAIKEDITEKKKMIEELVSSKEKAEVSEKIKTEFLAQMSHEIRSPLNVIMSFIGLIRMELEDVTEDMQSSFQSIESASTRIIRTIDLILNMTDLQHGSYESVITEVDAVSTLSKIKSEYKQSAENKGLELKLNMEFNRKKIYSDEYALIQIISNLVDNAIKYSDKGSIEIVAKKGEHRGLIIKVIDTGIGMSEEFLPNLFNSFTQEEQGYTRSYDGNGLGMALVKNYCDVISADIAVKSKKGKGTTFTIEIPHLQK